MSPVDARREFLKAFRALCHRWNAWDVWSDWLVMASTAIYNSVHADAEVEAQYMRTVSRYSREEADGLARLLFLTVEGLEAEPHDFLGSIFHELELHNEARGQFFTPFDVCSMMARMTAPEPPRPGRLLRVGEPACGSGAMVIAFHQVLLEAGATPDRILYELRDLDDRAFRMAYIQTSLLGLAAEVQRGNTLTLQIELAWRTPGYYLHDMPNRLRIDAMMRAIQGTHDAPALPEAIPEHDRGPGSGRPDRDPSCIPGREIPGDGRAHGCDRPRHDPETVPPVQDVQDVPRGAGGPQGRAPDAEAVVVPPDLILPRPGEQFSLFG